jgi:hypothetical protein
MSVIGSSRDNLEEEQGYEQDHGQVVVNVMVSSIEYCLEKEKENGTTLPNKITDFSFCKSSFEYEMSKVSAMNFTVENRQDRKVRLNGSIIFDGKEYIIEYNDALTKKNHEKVKKLMLDEYWGYWSILNNKKVFQSDTIYLRRSNLTKSGLVPEKIFYDDGMILYTNYSAGPGPMIFICLKLDNQELKQVKCLDKLIKDAADAIKPIDFNQEMFLEVPMDNVTFERWCEQPSTYEMNGKTYNGWSLKACR